MHNIGPIVLPAAVNRSQIHYAQLIDSNLATATAGIAWNTPGLSASYLRAGAARVAITLATQTVTGAYSSGGFVEVDATNMPGVYRLDLPDAMFTSGYGSAVLSILFSNIEYTAIFFEPWTSENTIADRVWDEQTSAHTVEGSTGSALSGANAASLWGSFQAAYTTPGTFGYLLNDRISSISVGSLALAPIVARVARTLDVETEIEIAQHAASTAQPIVITVVDSDGAAIDLDGVTTRFNVYAPKTTTALWSSAGSISGQSNNIVSVPYTAANTATAGQFRYSLWDTDNDRLLKDGPLTIKAQVKTAAV